MLSFSPKISLRYPSLDGLRALAVLAVVWHHTGARSFPHSPLLQSGYLGIHLFFFVSGFLITRLLLTEKSATGIISVFSFYHRRGLRILPLYYTTLLLYVVLVFALERHSISGTQFFHNLKYFLTLSSNWFVTLSDTRVIFYISWTLAAEVQFYLVQPWIIRYLRPLAIVLVLTVLSWFHIFPLAIAIGSVVALTSFSPPRLPLLNHPWITHIGRVSYGVYLLHMLSYHLLIRLTGPLPPLLLFLGTSLLTLLAASISHRYFESYFLRFKPSPSSLAR